MDDNLIIKNMNDVYYKTLYYIIIFRYDNDVFIWCYGERIDECFSKKKINLQNY